MKETRTQTNLKWLLALIFVLVVTSCSNVAPSPKSESITTKPESQKKEETAQKAKEQSTPFTYEGSEREQKLIEGAKKEGKLTWYTSLAGDVVNDMVKGFESKYPFIKTEVFRGDSTNLVQRVTQEFQARKNLVDVIEVTSDAAQLLREGALLTPYFSSVAQKLPEAYRTKAEGNTVWEAADRVSYIGFAYNKDKIPASAAPKTLNDLLKPELKDKLSIDSSTTGVRWVGAVMYTLGEQEGRKFLASLSKQNVKVQAITPAAAMGLIAQGEIAASMTIFQNHTEQSQVKGASVEWIPIEPVIANVGEVIVAKQAINPNATMLFVDFILGKEGEVILKKAQYSTPSDNPSFKYWLSGAVITNSKQYQEEYNKWQELFNGSFK